MSIPIIAIANNKGGVGKTKHSILISEGFSYFKHKKGLGVDMDGQGNFSMRFLRMEKDPAVPLGRRPPTHPSYGPEDDKWQQRNSIANIFYGQGIDPYPTSIKNFEITPGWAEKFLNIEAATREIQIQKIESRLNQFLRLPFVQENYDYVIIDTAPDMGPLTVSAFRAATDLVIVTELERYSAEGIFGIMQLWKQENEFRKKNKEEELNIVGIFPNKYDKKTSLHNDILNSLKNNIGIGNLISPSFLSKRIIYAELDCETASPRTVFDLPNNHVAKTEAISTVEYIYNGVFENG